MLDKVQKFLAGKKTYIIAGIIAVLTAVMMIFHITVPEWVWVGLGALGLGFIKTSIPNTGNVQLTGTAQKIFATKWGKYAIPVLLGVAAGALYLGVPIPDFVWQGLEGLGFVSLRANLEVAKNAEPPAK